jgi:hypothetical protein
MYPQYALLSSINVMPTIALATVLLCCVVLVYSPKPRTEWEVWQTRHSTGVSKQSCTSNFKYVSDEAFGNAMGEALGESLGDKVGPALGKALKDSVMKSSLNSTWHSNTR